MNPSGRLPFTIPTDEAHLPHFAHQRMTSAVKEQIARHLGVHPSTVGRWFTPAINGAKEETS